MLIIIIRTSIIYLTLITVMRLMGKRQIGEMQPFEFIVTLIIADLACIPMADVSIPLIYGIVAILALFIIHQIMSVIEKSGNFAKKVISGKSSVVITKNGVDISELKRNNLDVEDLIEAMRADGYFSLDDLDYAIFEANGKLSSLPKADKQESATAIPLLVVSDGKIKKENLTKLSLDEKSLEKIFRENNATLKDVEILTVDNNGKAYLKVKKQKYRLSNVPLLREAQW